MKEIKNCIYCQNQINNKEDKEGRHLDEKWWQHLKKHWICSKCNWIYYNETGTHTTEWQAHLKSHIIKNIYKCNKCFFKTDDYTRYTLHEVMCNNDLRDGMKRP